MGQAQEEVFSNYRSQQGPGLEVEVPQGGVTFVVEKAKELRQRHVSGYQPRLPFVFPEFVKLKLDDGSGNQQRKG